MKRFSALTLLTILVFPRTAGALEQNAPLQAGPLSITDVVANMIDASKVAAGDVLIVHRYGQSLGMSGGDITAFEIQYERLSSSANGLLASLAFQLEGTTPVDQTSLNATAAAILANARDLDASLKKFQDAAQAQQRDADGTKGGFDIGKFLVAILPQLNPIVALIGNAVDLRKKMSDINGPSRAALATRIRGNYWPDVRVATGTAAEVPAATPTAH